MSEPSIRRMSGCLYASGFNDPFLSDVTINFSSESIAAQKSVLSHDSKYSNSFVSKDFKVNSTRLPVLSWLYADTSHERDVQDIEVCDGDPTAVKAMLRFIYNEDYDIDENATGTWKRLAPHAHVYAAAEKYILEALKEIAASNLHVLLKKLFTHDDLLETISIVWATTLADDELLKAATGGSLHDQPRRTRRPWTVQEDPSRNGPGRRHLASPRPCPLY